MTSKTPDKKHYIYSILYTGCSEENNLFTISQKIQNIFLPKPRIIRKIAFILFLICSQLFVFTEVTFLLVILYGAQIC